MRTRGHLPRAFAAAAAALGAVLVFGVSLTATASSQVDIGQCLQATNMKVLPTAKITDGLGLPADVRRAVRMRLTEYGTSRYAGIDDLGLTPDQASAIKARIAAEVAKMTAHPVGWPCAPFKNKTAVVKYMRRQLVANGFRAAGLKFFYVSPRQIQYQGIQDGEDTFGAIVTSAPRTLTFSIETVGSSQHYTWKVNFTP
jgi:hypothetical protein